MQEKALLFTADGLRVDWRITPAPLLAGVVWNAANGNNDGAVSPAEAQAWVKSYLLSWVSTETRFVGVQTG